MRIGFWFSSLFLVAAIVLMTALPFLDKSFTIDDPFVLAVTANVLENPLDPFAGEFDWFGYLHPIWKTTTNPPLLSYYLAPFVAKWGYSEIALHAAMMLFLVLLAGGMVILSARFGKNHVMPLLFLMLSPAVMVSGNVMRDVPAAGLATAAIALFVVGTDRENRLYLLLGSLLAGCAILTKYSAIVAIPVMILYPIFKRRIWLLKWITPALLMLLVWSLHNIAFYGQAHIVYLTLFRRTVAGIPWQDKACGLFVILGSMLYLFPALFISELRRRRCICIAGCLPAGVSAFWFVQHYFKWDTDPQYLFWAVTGGLLLYIALFEGVRRGWRLLKNWKDDDASDSLFLFAWLCAPVLFSVIFVPFQAVRHQILALPPLLLLAFRSMERGNKPMSQWLKVSLIVLLVLQGGISYLVATVDLHFADTYRHMANIVSEEYNSDEYETWFVGHWGWKFYAERAGLRMRHRDGAIPKPGDVLAWPLRVHFGEAFNDLGDDYMSAFNILKHGTILKKPYSIGIPIRTMNFHGASFYATIGQNVPYRFYQDIDLETLKVFRVKEYDPEQFK